MHACHLIHGLGSGGAENVLVDLARVSRDAGLELSVIALMDTTGARHAEELRALGVPVHSLGLTSRWDPRAFARALRVVRALAPDVVHTHLKHADLVGAVVARRLHLPWVSTLHVIEAGTGPVGRGKRWVAGEVRRRWAARTVAVSDAQRDWYLHTFPADPAAVVTVHNGVLPEVIPDEHARSELRASLHVAPDAVLALAVAVMRPGKGLEDLLAAAAMLPVVSAVQVVLAGDGADRASLETLAAADPRISARVRFVGYRTDVPALMQAADLVVHPSHADALPTVLMQAMAAGRPVVATDVGGIPEIVGDEAGVLVPPGAPARLAAEIDALAGDPARRAAMGTAGGLRFAKMFDAHTWARELVGLYEEVLAQP
jgi:glycosyltransferase involved in cell wall biosynthesis